MAAIHLVINNSPHDIEIAPDTPLLWVLRDKINLTGTKYGCGMGLCGACTVHLDGEAVRACQTAVSSVGAKRITTIEGLSAGNSHPVQVAWIAEQVPQCGYCQPGQIMSAAALLAKTPHPSDQQIESAMAGNLCRCGMYQRIRQAIQRASGSGASGSGASSSGAGKGA
ncbi:MAG: (2Fe-2S)-binding protein [Candidatus Sulfotelmatobacter sp.]